MRTISADKFKDFKDFLSDRITVKNLEEGAEKFGGATYNKDIEKIYSNKEGKNYIQIKENNTLGLYIPNNEQTKETENKKLWIIENIKRHYKENTINAEFCQGSWISEETGQIIYDNLIVLNVFTEKMTENDIQYFIGLAKYVKRQFNQEAVTIEFNEAIAFI